VCLKMVYTLEMDIEYIYIYIEWGKLL
jgi:hypothetical protein